MGPGADDASQPFAASRLRRALLWAATILPFECVRIVSDMRYGSVCHIRSGSESYYLKEVSAGGREIAIALALHGAGMREHLPRIAAVEADSRFILYHAVQGNIFPQFSAARRNRCLSAYGRVQQGCLREQLAVPGLPRVTPADLGDVVRDYLVISASCATRRAAQKSTAYCQAALQHMAQDVLADILVLEHNDLHGGNVIFHGDRGVCILDWNDAVEAPVGFSLATAFDSLGNLYAAAQGQHCRAFERYAASWGWYLQVDTARIRRHMLYAAAFGSMRLACELSRERAACGGAFDAFYVPRIRFIVNDLLEVCENEVCSIGAMTQ
jgi:hypothetical protein